MSTNNPEHRIRALERVYTPTETCQTCHDHPRRYATVDTDTGEIISETMPRDGCPACGRLPLIDREYYIGDLAPDDLVGVRMFRPGTS